MPPAVSERQRKFMAGCYGNPAKMKGKCPPKKTAKHFMKMKKK